MDRRHFLALATASGCACLLPMTAHGAPGRIRKNLQKLPAGDAFFTDYAEAVRAMHALPESNPLSWVRQVRIHPDFCPHDLGDFTSWHRHYLVFFERICGTLIGKPNFALAYWDWTLNKGRLPAPFFAQGPLNVAFLNDSGVYNSPGWGRVNTNPTRTLTAQFGLQDDPVRGGAFTADAITAILRLGDFATFQRRLEGSPHNNGHVVSGGARGHMGDGLSPLDPIFWLHHCNVDRLWAEWQKAGNTMPSQPQVYDGQFVNETGAPQRVTAAQAGSSRFEDDFGYTYDILVDQEEARRARALGLPNEGAAPPAIAVAPQVVGTTAGVGLVTANVETRVPIKSEGLLPGLFESRSFRPTTMLSVPRVATEEARILAEIMVDHVPAEARALLVNVFIDCPYLSPQTPASDPHFAGSFSFFGAGGHSHEATFIVDLSEPLRVLAGDGRLSTDTVQLQFMPVSADPGESVEASFKVGMVRILRV